MENAFVDCLGDVEGEVWDMDREFGLGSFDIVGGDVVDGKGDFERCAVEKCECFWFRKFLDEIRANFVKSVYFGEISTGDTVDFEFEVGLNVGAGITYKSYLV